ncbi:MAG TPA: hypothetical protein VLL49_12090 [Anaerolineales bacterium]|nr:hypothetical protein [Anaerolineales bacterium]
MSSRSAMNSLRANRWLMALLYALATGLALGMRAALLEFRSGDFVFVLNDWYRRLQYDGLAALGRDFYDYNPPYIYLLLVVTRLFPGLPGLLGVKIPSILGDFICAILVQRLVALRTHDAKLRFLAYVFVLLSPPVVLNSAFWGQCDSLLAAALLACVLALLRRRPWMATVFFAAGLAFKPQAAFFLPLLGVLWLRGHLSWKHFLPIPLLLASAVLPVALAGRGLRSALGIYPRGITQYAMLTLNAPSLYAWLPARSDLQPLFHVAGLFFAGSVALLFVLVLSSAHGELRRKQIIAASTLCLLGMPFVLPAMHERYFYVGNMLAIVYAFYFRKQFYLPWVAALVEFFAYMPYLFQGEWSPVPLPLLALANLIVVTIVARHPDALTASDHPQRIRGAGSPEERISR